ncbi:hypothetical protein [Streptomyces sp. CRN 30]|uniref:hypothetical protein n=1 Tax=Streptomyces sp. CRN 30 TaxID=3075613 RepID=UPI002A81345C|nr:hypothetical protein [Streptomyces sp. CRN 30]
MNRLRSAVVLGVTAAVTLAGTPAFANWQSSISSWTDGNESRNWDDESYSEVRFKGCTAQYGSEKVTVKLWRAIDFYPDDSQGTHTFTNCYSGSSAVSAGEWTGLASGSYYFETSTVGDGGGLLDVSVVYVDTTKAD